ncbi:MAG: hypothetical protein HRT71_07690 [Flavobacteriales bacterium]|nr:hypothetical protein [Flavobacteriales bacterium]
MKHLFTTLCFILISLYGLTNSDLDSNKRSIGVDFAVTYMDIYEYYYKSYRSTLFFTKNKHTLGIGVDISRKDFFDKRSIMEYTLVSPRLQYLYQLKSFKQERLKMHFEYNAKYYQGIWYFDGGPKMYVVPFGKDFSDEFTIYAELSDRYIIENNFALTFEFEAIKDLLYINSSIGAIWRIEKVKRTRALDGTAITNDFYIQHTPGSLFKTGIKVKLKNW